MYSEVGGSILHHFWHFATQNLQSVVSIQLARCGPVRYCWSIWVRKMVPERADCVTRMNNAVMDCLCSRSIGCALEYGPLERFHQDGPSHV